MKYRICTLAISLLACFGAVRACGPFSEIYPLDARFYRACPKEWVREWHYGRRFQMSEKAENCFLWQKECKGASLAEIEDVVYRGSLEEMKVLEGGVKPGSPWEKNVFAQWLAKPEGKNALQILTLAKAVEELRAEMADPWYYPVKDDEEHQLLEKLLSEIKAANANEAYKDRYVLQAIRLLFALQDYQGCIDHWEACRQGLPDNIIRKMTASYVGGAYCRLGDVEKGRELFIEAEDMGSLMALQTKEEVQKDDEVSAVEKLRKVFALMPNSPVIRIKMQEYVVQCEEVQQREFNGYYDLPVVTRLDCDVWDGGKFRTELRNFALEACRDKRVKDKGLWYYTVAYLYFLEGRNDRAEDYLCRAEKAPALEYTRESIHAFRILMRAMKAAPTEEYYTQLYKDVRWLDERMVTQDFASNWQYNYNLGYTIGYWFDATRKILLGEVFPRLKQQGDEVRALQLANYACNRALQLVPPCEYRKEVRTRKGPEWVRVSMTVAEMRQSTEFWNPFDYRSLFFKEFHNLPADKAKVYVERALNGGSAFDRFLNERGYTDADYLYEHLGTLYIREMRYTLAQKYLSKVSDEYQGRTNLSKGGCLGGDPFSPYSGKWKSAVPGNHYKLWFAREMAKMKKEMNTSTDPNARASAMLRYAEGLRSQFGECWALTQYIITAWDHNGYGNGGGKKGDVYANKQGYVCRNAYAVRAYKEVDRLNALAFRTFTDPEQAARAHEAFFNYGTIVNKYGKTDVAEYVKGLGCDKYVDYHLERR